MSEAAAIILLDETGKYDFKSLELIGPEALSFGEIADMMSSITNLPIKYVSPSVDEVIKTGEFDKISGTLELVLGRKATTVETFLKNTYKIKNKQNEKQISL